ncbi:MAG: ribosome biogenesis GTP-binding protein YihA/YsxC [Akkermansiaceae bacterium]|nr:ribosome biogenesis GTP-binding protein YihA/YsxC [Akkermansiaceae bacterium]MDP4899118.1 ribosome biogenesis GTP-binding protein YihA/YsxC [Akkermansiaceae bacterium]
MAIVPGAWVVQIKSATFHISARNAEAAPEWDRPEFALIGRSNVGKSSMINMLTNKAGLAKVSATPGKTQLLNFFVMNEVWSLVDLPGYGFAKVAKNQKIDFNESVGDYLESRENLRRVFTLIDSRLPPQRIDIDFINWLGETGVPFALIFTKADKQSPTKTKANVDTFLAAMPEHLKGTAPVIVSSSKDRTGRLEILRMIQQGLD